MSATIAARMNSLGPEFHRWPAHPIYDLSDLIREVEAAPAGPTLGRRHHHIEPPPDPTHALSFWD